VQRFPMKPIAATAIAGNVRANLFPPRRPSTLVQRRVDREANVNPNQLNAEVINREVDDDDISEVDDAVDTRPCVVT